jgi:uncharacterized protein Usg
MSANLLFMLNIFSLHRTCVARHPGKTARQRPASARVSSKHGQIVEAFEDCMSLAHQIRSYRLTTAEILYHMPDHPGLLQTFVWQDLDVAPRFPVLHKFLEFWSRQLDGRLHSVRVGATSLVTAGEWRHTEHFRHLH